MKKGRMDKIKPIVDAFKHHMTIYDSGDADYSVTTILEHPRVVQLLQRYGHLVPFEVWRNIPSVMGTAMHEYIERMLRESKPDLYRMEERLEATVLGRKTSGAFDIWLTPDEQELFDIKTSKSRNYFYNDRKKWTAQQNIYRWLIHKHYGVKIKRLNIIFWAWEWSKFDMFKDKRYPKDQIVQIKLPVWSLKRTWEYIKERMQIQKDCESLRDSQLPLCGPDDYWGDGDQFAAKKKGAARALRLLDTQEEAYKWIEKYSAESEIPLKKFIVEYRPGERRRCERRWCGVRRWCNQWTDFCSMKGNL